jgi:hypothetical protein
VRAWSAWAPGEIGDEAAIDLLIAAMEKYLTLAPEGHSREQTKCVVDFHAAPHKLSGHDFGFDVERWRKWQADQVKDKSVKDK